MLRTCAGIRIAGQWRAPHLARASLCTSAVQTSAWATPQRVPDQTVAPPKPISFAHLSECKTHQKPIVCLTAYDYPTALAVRAAGADICLVGDSLANVALGHTSTRQITLEQMIHHSQAVRDAIRAPELQMDPLCPPEPLMIVDMPFGSCAVSLEDATRNVLQVVRATGTQAVKIEGSQEIIPLVKRLSTLGVSVMVHIGLQPQRFGDNASLRVQGSHAESAYAVYETAHALQEAGSFALLLECIPSKLGEAISTSLRIPTIGIGAGPFTSGQVLVGSDIVADLESPAHVSAALRASAPQSASVPEPDEWPAPPKFVRSFAPTSLGALRVHAFRQFADAVRSGSFPDNATESYRIKSDEWAQFHERLRSFP